MTAPAYKRILLKLSGEALIGDDSYGINRGVIERIVAEIKEVSELGVEVAMVVGGGNIFRGVAPAAAGMDRATADYMGMLATVLNALARTKRVPIYGINYKDKPADARAMLADLGDPYVRVGADRTGRVAIDWGVYGYPETFVVDRQGRVRYRHVGPIQPQDLDRIFYPLLKRLRG